MFTCLFYVASGTFKTRPGCFCYHYTSCEPCQMNNNISVSLLELVVGTGLQQRS